MMPGVTGAVSEFRNNTRPVRVSDVLDKVVDAASDSTHCHGASDDASDDASNCDGGSIHTPQVQFSSRKTGDRDDGDGGGECGGDCGGGGDNSSRGNSEAGGSDGATESRGAGVGNYLSSCGTSGNDCGANVNNGVGNDDGGGNAVLQHDDGCVRPELSEADVASGGVDGDSGRGSEWRKNEAGLTFSRSWSGSPFLPPSQRDSESASLAELGDLTTIVHCHCNHTDLKRSKWLPLANTELAAPGSPD